MLFNLETEKSMFGKSGRIVYFISNVMDMVAVFIKHLSIYR